VFAHWAPAAMTAAGPLAAKVAARIGASAAAAYQARLDRAATEQHAWLERRANELCGCVQPRTGDLFEPESTIDDWRSRVDPRQRLAGFAADSNEPRPQRGEAADVLRRMTAEAPPLPHAELRSLGLLMLVP
jgi:hypothetical protein